MTEYCVLINCRGNFSDLEVTWDSIAAVIPREQMEYFFIYDGNVPNRYETRLNFTFPKMDELIINNFDRVIDVQNNNMLNRLCGYFKNTEADILLFLNEGETINKLYLQYLNNFFELNPRGCGVVFIPVVHKGEQILPLAFQSLPPEGCFDFDENFPDCLTGAAVLTIDAVAAGLDTAQGSKALFDMVARAAKSKNSYGRLNRVTIEITSPVCEKPSEDRQFLVSCIISVYNVEKYLTEAIDSVLNQTIDFKKNVQLVLVNDGSTDSSGEICKAFAELYPSNIVYIEQDNRGLVAAQKAGLEVAAGLYSTFAEGDNVYGLEFMRSGFDFLSKNNESVNFVAFPLKSLASKEDYPLNYRFSKSGIIDVTVIYSFVQHSIFGTLIRTSALREAGLYISVDGGENIETMHKLVTSKMRYGVLDVSCLYYRETEGICFESNWRNDLINMLMRMLKEMLSNSGNIPKYTQHLAFSLLQHEIFANYPLFENEEGLQENIKMIVSYIDDDIIMRADGLTKWRKNYFLQLKYGADTISRWLPTDELHTSFTVEVLDEVKDVIKITGWYKSIDYDRFSVLAVYDNKTYTAVPINMEHDVDFYLGQRINKANVVEFVVPFTIDGGISLYMKVKGDGIYPLPFVLGSLCRLGNKPGAFQLGNSLMIEKGNERNELFVSRFTQIDVPRVIKTFIAKNKSEVGISEINLIEQYNAMYKEFSQKRIWLYVNTIYNNADSAIEDRIERYDKNRISYGSAQYKLMMLFAERIIFPCMEEAGEAFIREKDKSLLITGLTKGSYMYRREVDDDEDYGSWSWLCGNVTGSLAFTEK